MKKLISIAAIFVILDSAAYAQTYVPFLRPGIQWFTTLTLPGSPIFSTEYKMVRQGEDTLVNGKIYTKLMYSPGYREPVFPYVTYPLFDTTILIFEAFIREDTQSRQVFYLDTVNGAGEKMIYDFSLEKGDTFSVAIIDSVGLIELNTGSIRRCFYLSSGIVWIEGMGSSYSLFWQTEYPSGLGYSALTVFFEENECVYTENLSPIYWSYDNCDDLPSFSSSIKTNIPNFILPAYPNPFISHVTLTLQDRDQPVSCTATSMDGRSHTLSYTHTGAQVSVSTGHLPNGVYVIIITTKDGKRYRAKGVKY